MATKEIRPEVAKLLETLHTDLLKGGFVTAVNGNSLHYGEYSYLCVTAVAEKQFEYCLCRQEGMAYGLYAPLPEGGDWYRSLRIIRYTLKKAEDEFRAAIAKESAFYAADGVYNSDKPSKIYNASVTEVGGEFLSNRLTIDIEGGLNPDKFRAFLADIHKVCTKHDITPE